MAAINVIGFVYSTAIGNVGNTKAYQM